MPKAKTSPPRSKQRVSEPLQAVDLFQAHADALFRTARECCHQHDRFARVIQRTRVPEEETAAQHFVELADDTLAEFVAAYEKVAATVDAPKESDVWRGANSLWIASREVARRHKDTDEMTRRFSKHTRDELGALHTEFELEASALLALRHACEAYRKLRPEAV
jgi:hypothetical protein